MARADRMTADEQLGVAKKMYFGGFLLLPWLWFVNYLYFKDVVKAPHANQQLKTIVRRSLIGAVVFAVALIVWMTYFILNKDNMGALGQTLAVY